MYANLDKQPTSPTKNVARSINNNTVCPSPCHTTVAADIEAVTWIVCSMLRAVCVCVRVCVNVYLFCKYCSGPDPFLLLLIKYTGSQAYIHQKTENGCKIEHPRETKASIYTSII